MAMINVLTNTSADGQPLMSAAQVSSFVANALLQVSDSGQFRYIRHKLEAWRDVLNDTGNPILAGLGVDAYKWKAQTDGGLSADPERLKRLQAASSGAPVLKIDIA